VWKRFNFIMGSRIKRVAVIGAALALLVVIAASILFWPGAEIAPKVTIEFLGYTNRNRPYAILAITNRSSGAIALDNQCLMVYSTPVTSIEPFTLRVTRLGPGEGFVQEVFAFPGVPDHWRFECYASRTSLWPKFRRAVELWYYKDFRKMQYPRRSKTWHRFQTEAIDCPP
jgi:hypothetical protein